MRKRTCHRILLDGSGRMEACHRLAPHHRDPVRIVFEARRGVYSSARLPCPALFCQTADRFQAARRTADLNHFIWRGVEQYASSANHPRSPPAQSRPVTCPAPQTPMDGVDGAQAPPSVRRGALAVGTRGGYLRDPKPLLTGLDSGLLVPSRVVPGQPAESEGDHRRLLVRSGLLLSERTDEVHAARGHCVVPTGAQDDRSAWCRSGFLVWRNQLLLMFRYSAVLVRRFEA